MEQFDLFGNPVVKKNNLREMFGENPFSILDAKSGIWQNRKRKWLNLGIQSEIGRDAKTFAMKDWADEKGKEGKLKGNKDVIIMDLPGIYSLSPYTLEEVVARNYLIN